MKLLLTSDGLSSEKLSDTFIKLVHKPVESVKVAFIITASEVEEDKEFVTIDKQRLEALHPGKIENIDLKDYTKLTIEEAFSQYDVIWVEGGNTFYLLYWMRQSGFDTALKNLIKDKVYVGVSAGTLITSPNIEIANWKGYDDPTIVTLDNLNALNLVNFYTFVHDDPKWDTLVEEKKKLIHGELIRLKNGQGISIDDKKRTLLL